MKKILLVIGTRPEAIKMCPLLPALSDVGLSPVLCVSGQHGALLWEALSFFSVTPAYDLGLSRRAGEGLSSFAGGVMTALDSVLAEEKPDLVLVHGDTLTALAAAEGAFLSRIPVGHVEAGLRTGDLSAPFPEEHARVQIDRFASYLFAPTEAAKQNLLREGRAESDILVSGNTGVDAMRLFHRPAFSHPVLDFARERRLLLLTLHRRESQGEPMRAMLRAVRRICEAFSDVCVFFPCHPNPAVRSIAEEVLGGAPRVLLSDATDALTFQNILARAYLVLTDSGGVQEEAPYFGVPVLVLRERTERVEGVSAGVLRVVGTGEEGIVSAATQLLSDESAYRQMARARTPFGDGYAAVRIAHFLRERLV